MTDATRPASPDEHDAHVAASAIDHEIARLRRERETLLAPVREAMDRDGTTALYDDETGQTLYRLDDVTRVDIDRETLEADFPEVWRKVTRTGTHTRFAVKRVARAVAGRAA